jgi:hypothetical protein
MRASEGPIFKRKQNLSTKRGAVAGLKTGPGESLIRKRDGDWEQKREDQRMYRPMAFLAHHLWSFLPILFVAATSCRGDRMNDLHSFYGRLDVVPWMKWDALSTKKIFFGHQSVGQNIIDGIKAVMDSNSAIRLNIRQTSDPGDMADAIFAHAPIGLNMDPKSKVDDFRRILESGVGQIADIAMFKFCFIDITRTTDIESLFNYYNEIITNLERTYPRLRIITFTVPLTNMPTGIKPIIKRILGMMPPYKDDNKRRNIFNIKIRNRFGRSVFDIAEAEATLTEGKKTSFRDGNEAYELLNPAYTSDGGHLNMLGRQIVAIDLLLYLLSLGPD